MLRFLTAAMCVLTVTASATRAAQDAVTLVENGRSDYVVVLGEEASPSEQWAADEFIEHVRLMSGVTLPRMVAPDDLPERAVLIGASDATRELGGPLDPSLGPEGFVIRTVADRIVIVGGRKRGTMYGVFTLLERLGCRWWTPTESTIPRRSTITVGPLDLRGVPKLEARNIMYAEGHSAATHAWYVRNKLNGIGWNEIDERMGGDTLSAGAQGHNSIDAVQASVDEMTPEMWALVEGERSHSEICPTNKTVIRAAAESLIELYRENPDTPYVILSHEDNRTKCRCATCAPVAEREGDSGPWFTFINGVAEQLEDAVPGARVMTSAYLWTRKPPKDIRPRQNVIIRFAPIEADYAHPIADASNPENREIKEDIAAWDRVAEAMMIWNYVGNRAHYLMPNPDLDSLVTNIKFFVDHGATGIMQQGTHAGRATEFVPLRMWVLAKALWNPDADGDALIDEFLHGYYGPAAPALAEYIDVMHRYGRENDYHLGRVTRMNVPFLQPAIIAEAEEVLREADRAVEGDPELERRVRHAHMPVWYVLAKRGPLSRTWKATEERVGPLDFAGIAAKLNRVRDEYGVTAVADPEEAGPFFEWLTDYGRLLRERGRVLPPELSAADLDKVRLLQARQIDSGWLARTGWWVRDDRASDGWALKVPVPSWLINHHFSPYEECAGADRFRLFVRVRGGEMQGEGEAFVCGTRGGRLEVTAEELADGEYHVFEVGEFDVSDDMMMYIALSRPSVADAVYLDCLWLEPVE